MLGAAAAGLAWPPSARVAAETSRRIWPARAWAGWICNSKVAGAGAAAASDPNWPAHGLRRLEPHGLLVLVGRWWRTTGWPAVV